MDGPTIFIFKLNLIVCESREVFIKELTDPTAINGKMVGWVTNTNSI